MNDEVKMIPIERIRILNPRHRDQSQHASIAARPFLGFASKESRAHRLRPSGK